MKRASNKLKLILIVSAVYAAFGLLFFQAGAEDTAAPQTEAQTEAVTEAQTEAETEAVTETVTETVTEAVTEAAETETEAETTVAVDEWIYSILKEATPEEMEMIEGIVMGGIGALDKLGIKGFDRVRIWVEYNTATVMVIALIMALVAFFVATMIQRKTLAKDIKVVNGNTRELYKAGQQNVTESKEICERCAEAAEASAEEAKKAVGMVAEERAMLIKELDENKRVNAALCETIYFLMSCTDLSVSQRDRAEEIFRRGVGAAEETEDTENDGEE